MFIIVMIGGLLFGLAVFFKCISWGFSYLGGLILDGIDFVKETLSPSN